MTAPSLVENVTCLGCGCACDDIGITVRDGRITEARNACDLGEEWFGDGQVPTRSRIGDREYPPRAAALTGVARPPKTAAPPPEEGWLAPHRFADHERRFAAWRTLSAYPLTVLVGLSERERLAPLQDKWAGYRRARLAAEAALLALAAVLAWLRHALERKRLALRSIRAGYRLATEAGEEGFYLLQPVRAGRGRIVDFRFLDCNERGAQLLGKSRKELLGQMLSANYGQDDFARLRRVYCQALEAGSHREEVPFHPHGGGAQRWVRRKIVRSGDALAVTLR